MGERAAIFTEALSEMHEVGRTTLGYDCFGPALQSCRRPRYPLMIHILNRIWEKNDALYA